MSTAKVTAQHAEWLAALDGDGPWLTIPALTERLSSGLIPTNPEQNQYLKTAHTRWSTAHPNDAGPATREWVREIVQDWLGWGDYARFGNLERFSHTHPLNPSRTITTTPAFALLPTPADQTDDTTTPIALGFTHPTGTPLTRRVGDGWPTTPLDRAIHALRNANVPLGIVTDGKWWALIWAPRQTTPGYALWSTDLLLDDELLRAAFTTLLSRHRSLGVAEPESLHGLFVKSQDSQEDITENLSRQVRAAVELLVDSFSTADSETKGAYFTYPTDQVDTEGQPILARVSDDDIYQAAVTIVMRLVFILAAEERQLLPADDEFYAQSYGLGALADRLIDRANRDGEHLLRETASAFPQVLSASRVIHDGVRHPRLDLPGYGGSVFNPHRFPWLEDSPTDPGRGPIGVDDRTMLHILRGLTRWEGRRLSYRTLDVEQIGYAYEGLLDHTASTATEPILGLTGSREPEVPLSVLEDQATRGSTHLAKWLKDTTGLTPARITKLLAEADQPVDAATRQQLDAACHGNTDAADRIEHWLPLLRADQRTGLPIVINPGTTYVTVSAARGDTGTHYTPKSLAEDVVKTTLDALIYSPGPLNSHDDPTWLLIHPEKIIELKVADITMGSGAFLVATIRYLADALLVALEQADRSSLTTPALSRLWDDLHTPDPERPDWEQDHADDIRLAARQIIAAHTIYGVDINPMAVEMAKLSIWLVTAARSQPFGFLDHRLHVGDSLLGIHDIRQIENLHLKPERGATQFGTADGALFDFTSEVRLALARIRELRAQIDKQDVHDLRAVEEQSRLYAEIQQISSDLTLVADGLAAAGLAAAKESTGKAYDKVLDAKTSLITQHVPVLFADNTDADKRDMARAAIDDQTCIWLALDIPEGAFPRHAHHWPLAYPEVFVDRQAGFDAVVGNPPFLGGQKITGALGTCYRSHLVQDVAHGAKGSADLVAYMLLRADGLAREDFGQVGLLTTNTIAEGDTREVGLDQIVAAGHAIRFGVKSQPWPSRNAALNYSVIGLTHASSNAPPILDGALLPSRAEGPGVITSSLIAQGRVTGKPYPLVVNRNLAFQGSIILGMGFTLTAEEAGEWVSSDERYQDVLFPYLSGDDLNSDPQQSPSRWVINFRDWSEERARDYPLAFAQVERLVKPQRQTLNDANSTGRRRKQFWWQYGGDAKSLYAAISGLETVLAVVLHSSTVTPLRVPARQVFSHALAVFASESDWLLGLLSSSLHTEWARRWGSSIGHGTRYTPSDVFETFPFPHEVEAVALGGAALEETRRELLETRKIGATDAFNLMNDPEAQDGDVQRLRAVYIQLDAAVLSSYGWTDIDPEHDFHETDQGIRYTISPGARAEILDRLLELNHQRHAEEVAAGSADSQGKPVKQSPGGKKAKRGPAKKSGATDGQGDLLFAGEGDES